MPTAVPGLRRQQARTVRANAVAHRLASVVLLDGSQPGGPWTRLSQPLGETAPAERASKRILLVDDQQDILESLAVYLEASLPGVEVAVASSAKEALGMAAAGSFDLVITDLRMPEMNGLDFTRSLRASHPALPVFLMTAYAHTDLGSEARRSTDFQEFVPKPIDPKRLVALARGYLAA